MQPSSRCKGIFYGCLAAICYGTNPLGALNLYSSGYTPETVLSYRFFTGVVLLGLLICFHKSECGEGSFVYRHFAVRGRDLKFLLLLGFLFGISSLTYYESFKFMDAGLASTLLFLYPLEVAVMMGVIFKEKLTLKTAISIFVSLLGLALLYRSGEGGVSLSTMGLVLVFVSSLSYAIYIVVVNKSNMQIDSVRLTFYAMVFCLATQLVYSITLGKGFPPIPSTPADWFWAFMLGFVPTVLSLVFMAKAVKLVGSTPTAITGALEPLTAVCIGVFVFGEAMTLRLALGIILILVAVSLLAIKKK